TLDYITEKYNTEPRGPDTLPNTTKLGIQQTTSEMQPLQLNSSTNDTQESPEWINLVPTNEMGPHEGWGDPVSIKIEVTPTSPEESRIDDVLEWELLGRMRMHTTM